MVEKDISDFDFSSRADNCHLEQPKYPLEKNLSLIFLSDSIVTCQNDITFPWNQRNMAAYKYEASKPIKHEVRELACHADMFLWKNISIPKYKHSALIISFHGYIEQWNQRKYGKACHATIET